MYEQAASSGKTAKKGKDATGVGFLLLLDVELNAPVIKMPRNSESLDALEVDLGTFTLTNRIAWVGGEGSASDRKVILPTSPCQVSWMTLSWNLPTLKSNVY